MTAPKSPMEQFLDEDVATAIAPLRGLLDDGVLEAFGDARRGLRRGPARGEIQHAPMARIRPRRVGRWGSGVP